MEDKKYASIAEIDAALDEEFKVVDEDPVEEDDQALELDSEDELDETDEDEDDLDDEEDDEDVDPKKPNKVAKSEQQRFAFEKLREERAAAIKKAEQETAFMKKLAKASGYGDDVEKYRQDLEKRLIEQEASQRGITPEVYKELAEEREKNQRYEREKAESDRLAKSQKFLSTIDSVLSQYDVDTKAMSKELFASLEKAGYTIDTLLAIPQPEFLIRGALYDKLSTAQLREQKIRGSVETKKISSKGTPVKTMDELLDEEMAAYAKSRGLKYVK